MPKVLINVEQKMQLESNQVLLCKTYDDVSDSKRSLLLGSGLL